jgi:hypothetical protein
MSNEVEKKEKGCRYERVVLEKERGKKQLGLERVHLPLSEGSFTQLLVGKK